MNLDGYLLAILGTVLTSAILTAIVPEGKTSATVKGVAKLVCLLVIIAPIPRFLQMESFFDETSEKNTDTFFSESVIQTDESFINYYSEMRVRYAEQALETELLDKYSLLAKVTLAYETEAETSDINIKKITVKTEKETNEEVKKEMWEYLTKNYCSEVLIE